jgi:mannose-1-phosphate guanylyltransferase
MFVWKTDTYFEALQKYLPEVYVIAAQLCAACDTPEFEALLETEFPKMPSVSVDFGVLEKTERLYTIPGSFGWDDVGSWLALERINKTDECGNYVTGDVISIDTTKSIICGNKKLIATLGVEDLIVVDTDDAMLICAKDHTQQVKKVIETLRTCNRRDLI